MYPLRYPQVHSPVGGIPVKGKVAWYDPSDLSTMFNGDWGAVPVANAGDAVTILLDKSKGLAVETHLTSLGFNPTHWTDNGDGSYTRFGGDAYSRIWQVVPGGGVLYAGKIVRISFDYSVDAGSPNLLLYRRSVSDTGNQSLVIATAGETGHYVAYAYIYNDGSPDAPVWIDSNGGRFTISNLTTEVIAGNHLVQTTAAARPTYQTDGNLHWLEFDGVDDCLQASSRLGLPVDASITSVCAVRPLSYDTTVERIWALGEYGVGGAGTLSVALGTSGISWRHNNGFNQFGDLAVGTDAVLSFARSSGTTFGATRAYQDGDSLPSVNASGQLGVPTDAGEGFRVGASVVYDNVLNMRLYGLCMYSEDLPDHQRSPVEYFFAAKAGIDFDAPVLTPAPTEPTTTGLVAWYDPSDTTTMYQDVWGNIPVAAAGDPIALMLDKSGVEGTELWTGTATLTGNGMTDNGDGSYTHVSGSGSGEARIPNVLEAGKLYRISFDMTTGGQIRMQLGGGNTAYNTINFYDPGSYVMHLVPGDIVSNNNIRLFFASGTNATASNISVKELSGNHLRQDTAAAQPTYQTDGSYHWLAFDGVDDVLSANVDLGIGLDDFYIGTSYTYEGGTPQYPTMFASGSTAAGDWMLRKFVTGGTINFYGDTGNIGVSVAASEAPTTEVASVRRIDAALTAYRNVDGVAGTDNTAGSSLSNSTGPLQIGCADNLNDRRFTGRIYGITATIGTLTDQERIDSDNYLMGKAGTYVGTPAEPDTYSSALTYGGDALTYGGATLTYGEN